MYLDFFADLVSVLLSSVETVVSGHKFINKILAPRHWDTTHSLTAARSRLWVVAPSMLTGHQQEPMRQQQ